ncbi:hypothetical protein P154DRAFT_598275 [Amniculicola lignicola CBS 123094]|uniref:Uncharacterized protein n=1 Tax=Amniculicola lignicola CBS 123094 TaxID=1392246 RepID=A0A6A5WGD4_9PLEO|nr:hypothetical protein P154DRAFT_598275 [Amniculicola lignicola CBS 123094]
MIETPKYVQTDGLGNRNDYENPAKVSQTRGTKGASVEIDPTPYGTFMNKIVRPLRRTRCKEGADFHIDQRIQEVHAQRTLSLGRCANPLEDSIESSKSPKGKRATSEPCAILSCRPRVSTTSVACAKTSPRRPLVAERRGSAHNALGNIAMGRHEGRRPESYGATNTMGDERRGQTLAKSAGSILLEDTSSAWRRRPVIPPRSIGI